MFRKISLHQKGFQSKLFSTTPKPLSSLRPADVSKGNNKFPFIVAFLFITSGVAYSVRAYDNSSDLNNSELNSTALNIGYFVRKSKLLDSIVPPKRSLDTPDVIMRQNSEAFRNRLKETDLKKGNAFESKQLSSWYPKDKTDKIKEMIGEINANTDSAIESVQEVVVAQEPALQEADVEERQLDVPQNNDAELEALLQEVATESAVAAEAEQVISIPENNEVVVEYSAVITPAEIQAPNTSGSLVGATPEVESVVVANGHTSISAVHQEYSNQVENHATLKRDLHATILQDLSTLNEGELKRKIGQLSGELFERSRWEGVRLQQALKRVEAEVSHIYRERLDAQRREIEKETTASLQQMENDVVARSADLSGKAILMFETQLAEAMREQAVQFEVKRRAELEKQVMTIRADNEVNIQAEVTALETKHSQHVLKSGHTIEVMQAKVTELNHILDQNINNRAKSVEVLNQVSLVHAFDHVVTASRFSARPVALANAINSITTAFPRDSFVLSVLKTVPDAAKNEGILSEHALNTRFQVLRDEMRKVALAPPASSGMLGHFIGSVLATISSVPKVPVAGSGVEETLSRVAYHMEHGQLTEALSEMESVTGYASKMSEDWKSLVKTRLATESASETLKAYAHLFQQAHAK